MTNLNFMMVCNNSLQELQELPVRKGRMFLNSIYTDGHTCRVSFARNAQHEVHEESRINLELNDFTKTEIDDHFRSCFIDPNRNSAFVAHYDGDEVRKLSTTEYYTMSGSTNRSKIEDNLKQQQGIKSLETQIPTAKTSLLNQYSAHIIYMMTHLADFFNFYSFRTASVRWNNYRGRQCAIEEACNILINGGKKYNHKKRKKTKSNRRKRKKMLNRRNPGIPHLPVNIRYCK